MPASLINAVVDSAVNAGVVPCGNQQPGQISHYPPPVSSTPVCAVVSPPGVGISGWSAVFCCSPARLKKLLDFSFCWVGFLP